MRGLCIYCSMECMSQNGQLCRLCFDARAKAVYWDREPACNAKGPTKAQCLLEASHDGRHEGNGFDDYGEIYRTWASPGCQRPAPGWEKP